MRSLRLAAERLETAGVYPFLSILAHKVTERIGCPDETLAAICRRVTPLVVPLDSVEGYERRMDELIDSLLPPE
ncbi:hypothetical protein ACFWWB_17895 [Streptomyces sp. NPDC058690]|uniref:hypothetical protein n=1 Tax=Streptomyces sp. NPDC058690 TaxID=3346600 RepID=UPI003646E008